MPADLNTAPPPALSLLHLRKHYAAQRGGQTAVRALDDVSLDIAQGEFFGLLGPNGAGKTTLISILAGLTRATSGDAYVMGHHVVDDYAAARLRLGVVPQELVFDPFFNVRETLAMTSGYYGIRRNDAWIDEILFNLDLTSKANANMRSLSGGMKRRVLVAQALVHRPPVIILDEPTAGVDVALRQTLWKFIARLNREGHTVVLTTHYLEEAEELCSRIGMLKGGRLVALDSKEQLLKQIAGLQLVVRLASGDLPTDLAANSHRLPNGKTAIRLSQYNEVEPTLAALRLHGAVVDEIDLQRADLEDVFLQIMDSPATAIEQR